MDMARKGGKDRGIFIWPGQLQPGEDLEKARKTRKLVYGIRYVNEKGREVKEKAGSHAIAKALYAKRKTQVLEGRHVTKAERITIATAVQRYLDTHEDNRSRSDDLWHADVIREAFGKQIVDDLEPHDVEVWMQRRAREVSPSTVNRHIDFLRRCLKRAIRDRKARVDPIANVDRLEEPPGRERYLSVDELRALRDQMSADDWEHVELAIQSGFRREEQFCLRKDQVDFDAGPRLHGHPTGMYGVRETKSGATKWVPMNAVTRRILRRAVTRSKSKTWVFPSSNDTPVDGHNFVARRFKPALRKAGIDNFRWHDLRHCFGSYLRMRGVPTAHIAKLLGHTTERMAERYSHLGDEHLAEAVEFLEDLEAGHVTALRQVLPCLASSWRGRYATHVSPAAPPEPVPMESVRSDTSENNRKAAKKAPHVKGP
jgi:integrase